LTMAAQRPQQDIGVPCDPELYWEQVVAMGGGEQGCTPLRSP